MSSIIKKFKKRLACLFDDANNEQIGKVRVVWQKPSFSSNPLDVNNVAKVEKGHRITPSYVSELNQNEVFVFGSNIWGIHDGGASECAVLYFGAQMGQAEGPQGKSYAIPTDGCSFDEIKKAVDRFILFAEAHPKLIFLVTEIGCGTAGFHPMEIAPLFIDAFNIHNIYLPTQFWKYIKQ